MLAFKGVTYTLIHTCNSDVRENNPITFPNYNTDYTTSAELRLVVFTIPDSSSCMLSDAPMIS